MLQELITRFFMYYLTSTPYIYSYVVGFVTVWGLILTLDLGRFFHFLTHIHGKIRRSDRMMRTLLVIIIIFNITTTLGIAYSDAGTLMELVIILNILFSCYMIKVTDFFYRTLLAIDPTPNGVVITHSRSSIIPFIRHILVGVVDLGRRMVR